MFFFCKTVPIVSIALIITACGSSKQVTGHEYPQRVAMSSGPELTSAVPLSDPESAALSRESYDHVQDNPYYAAAEHPLSTFSIDVDTASYSNVRRILRQGTMPPPGAARIEEMINYFSYAYAAPEGDAPYAITTELGRAPWNDSHWLLQVGMRARKVEQDMNAAKNLVFLLDVSGSMSDDNKLPLLRQAAKLLVEQLDESDRVSIVVYAGASGVVLKPTPGNEKSTILSALDRLEAGGSTNGAAGIELAYSLAEENLAPEGINRIILATDGDFNVGTTNQSELIRLIEKKRETGVYLTVLGFGMGNHQDSTLEKLADKGNGNYGYIDTIDEARKILVDELGATLVTVAEDVKLQLEFNPAKVAGYRLIGYENRVMRAEEFEDDAKDAGEVGAGHTVTALYEIVPAGVPVPGGKTPDLRYQEKTSAPTARAVSEILLVKTRYKSPGSQTAKAWELPVTAPGHIPALNESSTEFRFAAAVAGFGMLLRKSPHRGETNYQMVSELASSAIGADPNGYRREFAELVDIARKLAD